MEVKMKLETIFDGDGKEVKRRKVYGKKDIIELAHLNIRYSDVDKDVIEAVYQQIEKELFDILSSTSSDNQVEVKLFDGLKIDSFVDEPHAPKRGNIANRKTTKRKVIVKPTVTRYYSEKVTKKVLG